MLLCAGQGDWLGRAVTGVGLAWLNLIHHAEITAGQRGCNCQVWIAVGAGETVLESLALRRAVWHTQTGGAVVVTPVQAGRRSHLRREASVRVHVWCKEGDKARGIFLHAADKVHKALVLGTVFIYKNILARFCVDDALVQVKCAARLIFHGFCHESRVDPVAQRGFPHGAFEGKYLVRQLQRVTVQEVNLHLRCARFVNQGVDIQPLRFTEIVHVLDDRLIFVGRIDTVRLSGFLGAP